MTSINETVARMTITNRLNLPQPLVDAVVNDEYTRGEADISVTGLLSPPRQAVLKEQHAHEITEDVVDRIWSLLGQAVHVILERADSSGITEERLFMDLYGWRISGQFDRLSLTDGVLQDYKVTSTYTIVYGDRLAEWEAQLNLYALLAREHGREIKGIEVVAILRDWMKSKVEPGGNYPPAQVAVVPLELWTPERQLAFLQERVSLHQKARFHLPECTREERWQKDDKWAVMKEGRKSALRVLDSKQEAWDWADENGATHQPDPETTNGAPLELRGGISIQLRPGESTRCESYCPAAPWCDQFKALKEEKND